MTEKVHPYKYCPKCGAIGEGIWGKCGSCGYPELFTINPKWEITDEKWIEIHNQYKYGEITYRAFCDEWRAHCKPFIEEVVMKRPEFDEWAYRDRDKRVRQKQKEKIDEEEAKAAGTYQPKPPSFLDTLAESTASSLVQCPYCKSYCTRKISGLSRAFSAGLFGLGSKKIGKQWHCTNCGSDF